MPDHKAGLPNADLGRRAAEHAAADLADRPRRNRRSAAIRGLVHETDLTADRLVYPLFVHDKDAVEPIAAMPGCSRHSIDAMIEEAREAHGLGVNAIAVFPAIDTSLKTPDAAEAYNPDGLIPRAVDRLRRDLPGIAIVTDVALDPYSSVGHDGLVANGEVDNDATLEALCHQALVQADAGASIVAPSDMMDGRVDALRQALDEAGHTGVAILAYTAKYASALYGPFREALDSAPVDNPDVPRDKKTYQMDPANVLEAERELSLDEAEGADMVMVKPAGFYLDVIHRLRQNTELPIAAYQVSGEYAMIQAAAQNNWLNEQDIALESLLSIRRAGANLILSYFAKKAAGWLAAKRG